MYQELVDLLQEKALEEGPAWTITTFHDFIAVEATLKETAPDRNGAWELANLFCEAVFELGYELSGALSRVGVASVWGPESAWQGTIELRVKPIKSV